PTWDAKIRRQIVGILRHWQGELGAQMHVPSSAVGTRHWVRCLETLLPIIREIELEAMIAIRHLDIGGGWHPDDWDVLVSTEFDSIMRRVRVAENVERVIVEPGKALAQPSMCLVTSILEIRRYSAGTEFVVDAGIGELQDLGSHPHRMVVRDQSGQLKWVLGRGTSMILGRTCMEADVIARGLTMPR